MHGRELKPQPLFTSLKNGMQQMVDALVDASAANRRFACGSKNLLLRPVNDDWQIESARQSMRNFRRYCWPFRRLRRQACCGSFIRRLIEGLAPD